MASRIKGSNVIRSDKRVKILPEFKHCIYPVFKESLHVFFFFLTEIMFSLFFLKRNNIPRETLCTWKITQYYMIISTLQY